MILKGFSTFTGIGGFEKAILDVCPNWNIIGYSEIDKYAISIYNKHFPNAKNYGDISLIDIANLPDFDILFGGSPCTDLSIAKKNREGLKGKQSKLFYKFVEILNIKKPKYFLLENVASMPKESKDIISKLLGVEPVMINASLVSAQQRKRLFWCNWKVEQPIDRNIYLKDILENKDFYGLYSDYNNSTVFNKSRCIGAGCGITRSSTFQQVIKKPVRIAKIGKGGQGDRVYSIEGKSISLNSNGGGRGAKTGLYHIPHGYIKEKITENNKYPTLCGQDPSSKHYIISNKHLNAMKKCNKNFKIRPTNGKSTAITSTYYKIPSDGNYLAVKDFVRKLTPIECERLQCFPDNWTKFGIDKNGKEIKISDTQRYKCIGNAVNVEVIKHIFKELIK